jgi:glycerol-3-phosphate dehydrogenase
MGLFSEDKKNDDYDNNDNRSSVRDRSTSFDALVVGGGIMGVCIARDLASSGYKVAIVERDACT